MASSTTVPNLSYLTQAQATSAIVLAGLAAGTITSSASATTPSGYVSSQTPSAGAVVAAWSSVDFVVSTGTGLVPVPNVTWLTLADAQTALLLAGLNS